jgi:hypothetical protein
MDQILLEIGEKWQLPKKYLEFLKKNIKKGIYIEDDEKFLALHIYAAKELIKGQLGYSYNPLKKEIITDWPEDYVVIADDGADPYVLDLSKSDGIDAPVLFAYHGEGAWDFSEHSDSFTKFINSISLQ